MLPGLRGDIERAGLQSALEHVLVYMHLLIRMLDTAPWWFNQTWALIMSKLQGVLAGVPVAFPDPLNVCVIRPKCLSFVMSLFVLSRRGEYCIFVGGAQEEPCSSAEQHYSNCSQPGRMVASSSPKLADVTRLRPRIVPDM